MSLSMRGARCFRGAVLERLTESPVQKMGHCSHGASRERTHVLRYGFRTINGNTGGVSVEALAKTAAAAPAKRRNCILGGAQGTLSEPLAQKEGLRLDGEGCREV